MRRLPAAYLAVVVVLAAARATTGHPSLSSLALTPDRLGHGKVWLLVSSGFIINGPVLSQLAALIVTLVIAARRLGARFLAAVMVMAHIGATLLAYAVLAVVTGDADGAHNRQLDYGISAVWLGALGALAASALPRARRRDPAAIAAVAVGVIAVAAGAAFFPLLAATEHTLAFAIGAGMAALRERRSAAGRWARSAASTASARAESA